MDSNIHIRFCTKLHEGRVVAPRRFVGRASPEYELFEGERPAADLATDGPLPGVPARGLRPLPGAPDACPRGCGILDGLDGAGVTSLY